MLVKNHHVCLYFFDLKQKSTTDELLKSGYGRSPGKREKIRYDALKNSIYWDINNLHHEPSLATTL